MQKLAVTIKKLYKIKWEKQVFTLKGTKNTYYYSSSKLYHKTKDSALSFWFLLQGPLKRILVYHLFWYHDDPTCYYFYLKKKFKKSTFPLKWYFCCRPKLHFAVYYRDYLQQENKISEWERQYPIWILILLNF